MSLTVLYAQNRKIGKPSNLEVFGSNKTKQVNRLLRVPVQ